MPTPAWLEKMQTGLLGKPNTYGILSDQEAQDARQNGLMNFGASLLAASGPSQMPSSFGSAFGQAALAGRGGQQSAIENSLNAALLKKQLTKTDKKDLIAVVKDGQPQYVATEDAIGMQPYSLSTPGQGSADIQGLNTENTARKAQGLPPMTMLEFVAARSAANVGTPFQQGEQGGQRGTFNRQTGKFEPATSLQQEAAAAGTIAGATQGAKETATTAAIPGQVRAKTQEERAATFIDEGLRAADALPVVNRAIQLLDTVKTGGIDSAKLAATNLLGVTGADEAELSNNMGKAVLSQLRATFGAAFTEREGERLNALEAGFGKSTEGNKRILGQVKQIVERAVRRGQDAAKKSGDTFSFEEMTKASQMDLAPKVDAQPTAPTAGTIKGGYKFKGGDPAKKENWVKQ